MGVGSPGPLSSPPGPRQESHCEQCGHREAVAHHHFSVLPRVLVLHLQRSGAQFAAAQAFVGHAKRSDPCAVSFEVDAEPHCTPDVLFPLWAGAPQGRGGRAASRICSPPAVALLAVVLL